MRRFSLMVMVLLTALFLNSSSAWSLDRFVNLGDGTVLDTTSHLRWLKNANCFGAQNWATAISSANNLASPACGLNDGSVAGDWHLPTIDELRIFTDAGYNATSLNNAGFANVQHYYYWSSTNDDALSAWSVYMDTGAAEFGKGSAFYVWPVRSGQFCYMTISPTSKDFGNVITTVTSTSQAFTISNNGTASVSVTGISLIGGDSGMFAVNPGDGTNGACGPAPTLAPGASCTVAATFTPTSYGPKSTTLRISSNAVNPASDITLSGCGITQPVSLWKADNNANDSVGSNNGTLQGGTYAPGKSGQAFSYDGKEAQYVSVPHSPSLDILGNHSIAFWIKLNELPAAGKGYHVVSKWTNGYENKQVSINSDGTVSYFLYGTTTSLLGTTQSPGVTSATELHTGVWFHVVATYDGGSMKIYINGVQDANTAAAFNDVGDGAGTLYLGYNPDTAFAGGEAYFNGLLDEVGWYNRTLSTDEIGKIVQEPDPFSFTAQTGMPLSTTIVSNPITVTGISAAAVISITGGEYSVSTDGGGTWGSWTNHAGNVGVNDQVRVRQTSSGSYSTSTTATVVIGSVGGVFGGVSGDFNVTTAASGDPNLNGLAAWWKGENNAYDSLGGNNGTMTGGTYAPGKSGQAFSFDGSAAQYVSVPASPSFDLATGHGVAFWVRLNALPASGKSFYLVNKWTVSAEDKRVSIDGNGKVNYFLYGTTSPAVTSATPLQTGVWTHVAATYDGTAMKIYINGVKESSAAATGDVSDGTGNLYLGYNPGRSSEGNEAPFNGQLDEMEWFNRGLSATDIGVLSGHPFVGPDDFSFTPQTGVALNTAIVSNSITVTGITNPVAISITGGEYALSTDGGGAWGGWSNEAGTVGLNNQVKVRLTSSASFATQTTTMLTIGSVRGAFQVTTSRFVDLLDGTVLDGVSSLRWLKQSRCGETSGGIAKTSGTLNWTDAKAWSNSLASGTCHLTDGSVAGDWHLPTIDELRIFTDAGYRCASLVNAGFADVQCAVYWSSSTISVGAIESAWYVYMLDGSVGNTDESARYGVWPVRSGQYWPVGSLVMTGTADFGAQAFGYVSSGHQFTLKNAGTGPLVVTSSVLSGADPDQFGLAPGGSSPCSGLTPTLDAGATCTLLVTAAPTSIGGKSASLIVTTAAGAANAPLTATAVYFVPTVTGVSPSSGPVTGGTTVTITGTGFSGATAVTFGATAATSKTVNSDTQITAVSTAGVAGQTVDITVTTPGGASATSSADQFTYTQDQAKNITTGTTYATLAAALSAALAGAEIRAYESQFDGTFILDKGLALKGGYDGTFLAKGSSPTTLNGGLTVTSGASTVETIVVKGVLAVQGGSLLVNDVTVRQ